MEAADEAFRSSTDKYKARVADLERQVTNLQKCANTSEKEREALDARLKQALQDGDRARKEAAIISGKEQVCLGNKRATRSGCGCLLSNVYACSSLRF